LKVNEDQINLEEFISYLDVEHFLQLKGSDHWSAEGQSESTCREKLDRRDSQPL